MRTRLSVCRRKARFVSNADALRAAGRVLLRCYRCDRCGLFHLTARRKGKRIARPDAVISPSDLALARE